MANSESLEPTSLLQQIQTGEIPRNNPRVIIATNFSKFLRPHIESLAKQFQQNASRDSDLSDVSQRESLAEVLMTGLQLAVDEQATSLTEFAHQTETTESK